MNKLNKNTKYVIALSLSFVLVTLISNVYATNNKTVSTDQELNATSQSYKSGKFNLSEYVPDNEVIQEQEITEADIKAREAAKDRLINLLNETRVIQEQDTGDQLDAAINPYSNETSTMQNGTLLVRGSPIDITVRTKRTFSNY